MKKKRLLTKEQRSAKAKRAAEKRWIGHVKKDKKTDLVETKRKLRINILKKRILKLKRSLTFIKEAWSTRATELAATEKELTQITTVTPVIND